MPFLEGDAEHANKDSVCKVTQPKNTQDPASSKTVLFGFEKMYVVKKALEYVLSDWQIILFVFSNVMFSWIQSRFNSHLKSCWQLHILPKNAYITLSIGLF